jgi:hypothetical protein
LNGYAAFDQAGNATGTCCSDKRCRTTFFQRRRRDQHWSILYRLLEYQARILPTHFACGYGNFRHVVLGVLGNLLSGGQSGTARKLTKAPAVPSAASSFAVFYPIFLAGAPDARGKGISEA